MSAFTPKIVAPFAVLGATWLARIGMNALYKSRTGHAPPTADDREVSLVSVIAWAAATAVVGATIDVVITRASASFGADEDFAQLDHA